MDTQKMSFEISLPDWVRDQLENTPDAIEDIEERMRLVIRFSDWNIEYQTGGPFAAAVFEEQTGKLVSLGVNRVVPSSVSAAHAEIVALSLAQKRLETFDLGGPGLPRHQLVVNGRPCAMCFGAIPWSGIRSLVVGAPGAAIESLAGFDEGPIHPNWKEELINRGIDVTENVLPDEACAVLKKFGDSDQPAYNGRGT